MPPIIALAWLITVILAIFGWVMNLIAILGSLNGEVTALLIVRCVGVFAAPLGALLGWFA